MRGNDGSEWRRTDGWGERSAGVRARVRVFDNIVKCFI
jgi:hypothetical protein